MSEFLNQGVAWILKFIGIFYSEQWLVLFIFLPIMGWFAWREKRKALEQAKPYLAAVDERIEKIKQALGSDEDPVQQRRSFAENYISVSAAMAKDGPGTEKLVSAWREFQETMVDENESPVRNTNRPTIFFNRIAPKQTDLVFASNIFVGVGLILTFLGLVVALNSAAQGMAGDDVSAAKQSLQQLLVVAGSKFFTSIAGLFASIWLRFVEHKLSRQVRQRTEIMCALLERGLLYVSQQMLAVRQLNVMEEQRDQLKFFNTDVALQLSDRIGQQFTQAISPMAASLSTLNENMTSVTQGIGAGAKEAIEKVSGEQLQGLSDTLTGLSQQLTSVRDAVGQSSGEAADQIRRAGEDFAKAASDIREAFGQLTGQVDGMGERFAAQSEAASAAQGDALSKMLEGIDSAQSRTTTMIAAAIEALQSATVNSANSLQQRVSSGLEEGVKASQATFKAAIEESGVALKETTGELSEAVKEAARQVERASSGFAQSGDRAAQSADALRTVVDNARDAATAMNEGAKGFAQASVPVAQATQSISQAAEKISQTIAEERVAGSAALGEMKSLAESVRSTHQSAEQAWNDYRGRFEAVDKSLAAATDKMSETLGDSMTQFREFAHKFDSELGSAVSRMGNSLASLEDYAGSLDEYVEAVRRPEPAE